MPAVVYDTDVLLHVVQSLEDRTIGHDSVYLSQPHPGSNKLIEGWKWDLRHWPSDREFKGMENAPSLWDPSVSGLDVSLFQSGYGDNDDLFLFNVESYYTDEEEIWAPKINHGYFYIQNEERYLFSDDYQAEYFSSQNVISGQQYLDMTYVPKVGVPILVRQYEFDRVLGRFIVSLDARKKVDFTVGGTEPEFICDTDFDPYRLWLNGEYHEVIGTPIVLTLGLADPAVVSGLELVGYGDNTAGQEFRTQFSPIDPLTDIEVWGYIDPTMPRQWDVLSGLDDFTVSGLEVKIDKDLGILRFGTHDPVTNTGAGLMPKKGERIIVYYTKGLAAFYEPEKTRDYILAPSANVNPIVAALNRGFVLLSVAPDDPTTIILEAEDLPGTVNPTYLIEMGNNIGRLTATVKNATGLLLEGQKVTFEMLDPVVGGFGSQLITTALTSLLGEAKTIYNPPTTINDIGQATANVSYDGSDTVMSVDGLTDPGTVRGLYLYKVHSDDPTLGIAENTVTGYYEDYLLEEDITTGGTATVPWEQEHRTRLGLGLPTSYEGSDLLTGKKTIILTNERADVIDPHTGDVEPSHPYPLGPLYPSTIVVSSIVGTPRLDLRFNSRWLDLPPDNGTKAYFVVGDAQTRIRAYVTNERTGKRIYSNTIGMRVTISDTANGTYFAETLADVPVGLLSAPQNIPLLDDTTINTTSGIGTNYEDYLVEKYSEEDPFVTVSVRARVTSLAGSPTGYLQVYQNGISTGTSKTFIPALAWTTYSFVLSSSEIALITDPANLELNTWRRDTSNPTVRYEISWMRVQIGNLVYQQIPAQSVAPDGDLSGVGTWIAVGGSGSDLYTRLNEDVASDSEYIYTTTQSPPYRASIENITLGSESYADWYRRTRRGDTTGLELAGLGPTSINVDPGAVPGEIPLGFRLKSNGITLASVLDQITYLDPNDNLPSGYFGV